MAGKTRVLLTEQQIKEKVKELAEQVYRDYQDKRPLLVCVLKGAVIFLSDFVRFLNLPVKLDFVAVSSYGDATFSSGDVRILKDLDRSIENEDIIIIEDIIDTGLTLSYLRTTFLSRAPASLKIVTLLDKPERRVVELEPDYCGFRIPNEFVVGYGLDFNERYRNLRDICILLEFDQ